MIWPTRPIIEEEFNDDENEVAKKFIKNDENWHNGETFIFESEESELDEEKDNRYVQFKTIIEEKNQNYFIYDEIIQINKKPVLLLKIHNDETREIWEQIIYFENNEVVEQIRHLTYDQFLDEMKDNKKILKAEEDNRTTIIRTPFLDFIENINQEKDELIKQQPIKKPWWKHVPWKVLGLVVFVAAWAAIPVIGNLLIAPALIAVGIPAAAKIMTWLPFVIAGLTTGGVIAGFNRYRTRLKKWLFPNWKSKSEINLENKLAKQRIMLTKKFEKKMQKEQF